MNSALGHIRVLDLSRILAGPWATQTLADLGAEVIKVERPAGGDDTRAWGPPFVSDAAGAPTRDSAYFLSANRGKQSLTVDFSTEEGRDIVRGLARGVDVLVENYKVGTLARYGLGYEDIRALNPRLVYCSVTGFGQDGPSAELPGYDFVFQGLAGLMSYTGQADGEPGAGPMKSGVAIGDLMTGLYTATAILAALEHRHSTGEGQYIDMALLDCIVATNSYQAQNYFTSGRVPRRMGNAHPNLVPYQVFRAGDADIIVAVGNDAQYAAFCGAIGRPELAADPRYARSGERTRNRGTLVPVIAEVMRTRAVAGWIPLLEAAGVPCGPVNDLRQVFADPQVRHRQMQITLPHTAAGAVPALASPLRLSATPVSYRRAAPLLGEHTDAILQAQLGLSPARIAELRARKVI
jgi:crotonobetainyl-CoA:carnitine CoA-transferase CaiB-like acyl-CoA transferase